MLFLLKFVRLTTIEINTNKTHAQKINNTHAITNKEKNYVVKLIKIIKCS